MSESDIGQILSNFVVRTIRADICLCVRLRHLHPRRRQCFFKHPTALTSVAFHPILIRIAPCIVHSAHNGGVVSVTLLNLTANCISTVRVVPLSTITIDVRTFLRRKRMCAFAHSRALPESAVRLTKISSQTRF